MRPSQPNRYIAMDSRLRGNDERGGNDGVGGVTEWGE
jgi:hypothetical protein